MGAILSSSWENIFKFANLRIITHVTEYPDFLYENGLVVASFIYRTLVFFTERMRTNLSFLSDNNFFKFQVS